MLLQHEETALVFGEISRVSDYMNSDCIDFPVDFKRHVKSTDMCSINLQNNSLVNLRMFVSIVIHKVGHSRDFSLGFRK